jgi:outer membrane protein assembly factor BamB
MWNRMGIVSCAKVANGEVVWRERVGGEYYGSPVCLDERLFCVSNAGEVVVVAATDEFKLLGRTDLGEACNSTPAVAGGRLYVRTAEHLISVGGKELP